MSYITMVDMFEGLSLEAARPILAEYLTPLEERLGFEGASSRKLGRRAAIAQIGGWVVAWTSYNELYYAKDDLKRLATGRTFALSLDGVADEYQLIVSRQDVDIEVVVVTQGTIDTQEGEPQPEEEGLPAWATGQDEDRLLGVMERCLGGSLAPVYEATYEVWAPQG